MEDVKWTHISGQTWCIETHLSIPVYLLNEREAVLLDSGYADRDRPLLEALLKEKGLRVRAVLGSHSHNDHSGNHAYFQRTQGSEIILRDVEAAIVSDFSLMAAAYYPATAEELAREMPYLLLKADRVFSSEDGEIDVDGKRFSLIPLPGHTPGHTGIVTPDGVFYAGDAAISHHILQKLKLPSTLDWMRDLETKRRLRSIRYPYYVLAHSGIYENIEETIEENILDKERRASLISGWLREHECWTLNEIEQYLWEKLRLRRGPFLTQIVFRRNVWCLLEYLIRIGNISREFQMGTDRYWVNT